MSETARERWQRIESGGATPDDLPRLIDALREAREWIKCALDAYYMQLGSDLEKDGRRLLGEEG